MPSDERDYHSGGIMSSHKAARRRAARRGAFPPEAAFARHLLRLRRQREHEFGERFFAEPGWDILLDLFASEVEGRPVAKSSSVVASSVPQSTALRWIGDLGRAGFLEPYPDTGDGRRTFIMLSDATFAEVGGFLARWILETRALLDLI